MEIVSVSAEMAPWSKTGGLGDVAAALPPALRALGHRVLSVVPRYKAYTDAWDTGIRLHFPHFGRLQEVALFHNGGTGGTSGDTIFVDHPAICRGGIYGDDKGGYGDNLFRFSLLCRAAIEAARRFPVGGRPLSEGGTPHFLTHDWHAGLLATYLRAHYQSNGLLKGSRVVHVIHNLAHQGTASFDDYWGLDLPGSWAPALDMSGRMNLMKVGLVTADKVVAVSPRYAREICTPEEGFGLDGVLRSRGRDLVGILNGIDPTEWNPRNDKHLVRSYGPEEFSEEGRDPDVGETDPTVLADLRTIGGKAINKAALQKELGLPVRSDRPLFGFIGRLTGQKGIDLIDNISPWLVRQPVQIALLGTGESRYEDVFRELGRRFPEVVAAKVGFDVGLAHRITAGADLLLMPSRFEPCGLNQLYALAYGTVPVVHATGGLADTVHNFDPGSDSGNGWAFSPATPENFAQAIQMALLTWFRYPRTFRRMQARGMAEDHGWARAARWYAALLAG